MNLELTGTICGGKGTATKILREYGFQIIGFGDEVRKEATARGIPHLRRDLQRLGAQLRIEQGKDVWCKRIAEQMRPGVNYAIDGIRYPEDHYFFRSPESFLISVDGPIEMRYGWSKVRGYERDAMRTLEEFKRDNDADLGLFGESDGQNVGATMELVDYRIWNDGTKHQLRMAVETILGKLHYRKSDVFAKIK